MGVNYGLNRVRFTAPVPVGSYVRGRVLLKDYQEIKNGAKLTVEVTVELKDNVKAITPVPGGVGPMTIACLLKNTLMCFKARLI